MPDSGPVALIGFAGHLDGGGQRRAEGLEAAVIAAALGQVEKMFFGCLDLALRGHVDIGFVRRQTHFLADEDELAADGEIVDGAAEIIGVDDGRRLGGETRQILLHRHAFDQLCGQEGLDRDRVSLLAGTDDLGANLVDLAVYGFVEMVRLEEVRDAVEGFVVDENGTEQGLLGFDIVRRLSVLLLLVRMKSPNLGHESLVGYGNFCVNANRGVALVLNAPEACGIAVSVNIGDNTFRAQKKGRGEPGPF